MTGRDSSSSLCAGADVLRNGCVPAYTAQQHLVLSGVITRCHVLLTVVVYICNVLICLLHVYDVMLCLHTCKGAYDRVPCYYV